MKNNHHSCGKLSLYVCGSKVIDSLWDDCRSDLAMDIKNHNYIRPTPDSGELCKYCNYDSRCGRI